jgi:hypothetical protein
MTWPEADRVSPLRLLLVVAATVTCVFLLLFGPSYIDEVRYWQRRLPLMLVVMPTRELALSAQDFRSRHGRYPTAEEFEALTGPGGGLCLTRLMDGARRLRTPLHTVTVPERGPGGDGPLMVAWGEAGRIEIMPGGGVKVTRRFAPWPTQRPSWLEIVGE